MMYCGNRTSKNKVMNDIRINGNELIKELLDLMARDDLDVDQMINLSGTINMAKRDLHYKFKKQEA